MAANLSSVLVLWRSFDLGSLQKELDETATAVAERQDLSDVSRRKLVEQMKSFKKNCNDEARKAVAPLLKSFQSEVDALTKRSKACESEFLILYKKLIELTDPVAALEQAESYHKKNQRLNDIETENLKLRDTLAEYNKEFAEVKNQEVTIKTLKDKIKEMEKGSASLAQRVIDEKIEQLNKDFAVREKNLLDGQYQAAAKLSESEQKCSILQSSHDALQVELFSLKSKYDEDIAGKQAEMDILLSDYDRVNQLNETFQKEIESLQELIGKQQNEMNDVTSSSHSVEQSIDEISYANLKSDLSAKEAEVGQLVEDVQHLQITLTKVRESSSSQISKLEEEISVATMKCEDLEETLASQSDYNEVKRELNIIKSTEFSGMTKEPKSLELLLMDKNKVIQADNTSLRAENAQLKELCESMEGKVTALEESKGESEVLVKKLEMDLMVIQSPAAVTRSAADGMPATQPVNMSGEFLADAIKDTTGTASSDNSLLMIVTSQRERFRLRNNELESENYGQQQIIQQLQNETDSMRADNVKLYEKIRYLQSYPTSKSVNVPMEDTTSTRYSSQYEDQLDPFTSFNRREKQRKYMNLSPPEKVTLGISKMILSSKLARTIFFFYMLFMHVLLYIVLYKFSYADDCKRHIAETCYEQFGAKMAPAREDLGDKIQG